jgi:signal peptidase I
MIKRILLIVVLALAGAGAVRGLLLEGDSVASGSMEPTLPVGTHYFVNKFVYRLHAPQRGEIIVFKSPVDSERGLIKRVIAIGGDRIEIRSKQIILNGEPLSEPYAAHKRAQEHLIGDSLQEMKVPQDALFVLGDNRDESEDSSVWKDPKTGQPIYFIGAQDIEGG